MSFPHLNVVSDKYKPHKILDENIYAKHKIPYYLKKTVIKKRKYWRLAWEAANIETKLKYLQLAYKCKIKCSALVNRTHELINRKITKAFFIYWIKNCIAKPDIVLNFIKNIYVKNKILEWFK